MSLLAKKYVKALVSDKNIEEVEEFNAIFSVLASHFSDEKFVTITTSNLTSQKEKEEFLLLALAQANDEVKNFVKLLIEKRRVSEIPAIAEELRLRLANLENKFQGQVLSSDSVNVEHLKSISDGLSAKLGKNIILSAVKSDLNGLKVVINDLNINITLSKSRIESDMINHILKAI
jgi:F-type H+-transporting ATPase subunit delta